MLTLTCWGVARIMFTIFTMLFLLIAGFNFIISASSWGAKLTFQCLYTFILATCWYYQPGNWNLWFNYSDVTFCPNQKLHQKPQTRSYKQYFLGNMNVVEIVQAGPKRWTDWLHQHYLHLLLYISPVYPADTPSMCVQSHWFDEGGGPRPPPGTGDLQGSIVCRVSHSIFTSVCSVVKCVARGKVRAEFGNI